MRKTVKNVVCILLILTLSLSTGLLAYLHFIAPGDRDVSGEWTARLPMTDQAAARAFGWLRDIEAVSVSLEEVEAGMQDLAIEVSLVFEKTDRSGGNFRCSVLPESYEACRQAAYEAFAGVFLELLAERLHMAGYTGGTDRESLEALVTGSFGMGLLALRLFQRIYRRIMPPERTGICVIRPSGQNQTGVLPDIALLYYCSVFFKIPGHNPLFHFISTAALISVLQLLQGRQQGRPMGGQVF